MSTETTNTNEESNPNIISYKAPAQKTVEELAQLDADDPSLVKYKQALLGNTDDLAFDKNDPRKVIVASVEIHSPELETPKSIKIHGKNANGGADAENKENITKEAPIKIKEGSNFHVEVLYYVQHEIVSGLRYEQTVKVKGIPVDKDSVMIGSFGPRKENYVYKSPEETAAKGMLARQTYSVKSKFIDDDKICHVNFDWKFEISKDW